MELKKFDNVNVPFVALALIALMISPMVLVLDVDHSVAEPDPNAMTPKTDNSLANVFASAGAPNSTCISSGALCLFGTAGKCCSGCICVGVICVGLC